MIILIEQLIQRQGRIKDSSKWQEANTSSMIFES